MLGPQQPEHCRGAGGEADSDQQRRQPDRQAALDQRVKAIEQAAQGDAGQHEPDAVERPIGELGVLGHNGQHQHHADDAERDVDPEVPVPGDVFGDEAAQRRTEHGREQCRPDGEADCGDDLGFLRRAQHDDASHREQHRTAGALQGARDGELAEILRHAAGDGGQREQRDGHDEDATRAEPVGKPGRRGNADRDRQHVDGDAEAHLERADVEIERHAGQGGDDDHPIQKLHEQRGGDHEGDVAGVWAER